MDLICGEETKILHATWWGKKKKKELITGAETLGIKTNNRVQC